MTTPTTSPPSQYDAAAGSELPPAQDGAAAWRGSDMQQRNDWRISLSDAEIEELGALSARLCQQAADLAHLRAGQLPLPLLAPRLREILAEVQDGRGFVLIQALPVQRWGRLQSAAAFMALGAHLGAARPQNAAGHLLGHVRDMGLHSSDPAVRIYQTNERQTFHTDSCDIVALLCLHRARRGGQSALVSSTTLFNEMRRRRPDLAQALFEPMATDRRGEVPPGQQPFFSIPVLNWWPRGAQGRLSAIYQRQYIESAQRFGNAPRLTPRQREALDLFDTLANDPALYFLMDLAPGDIQLVNNHTLLHDRTAFDDWPERERRRHLLRLWLAPPVAQALPPVYAQRYGSVEPGARGGISLPEAQPNVPLDGL